MCSCFRFGWLLKLRQTKNAGGAQSRRTKRIKTNEGITAAWSSTPQAKSSSMKFGQISPIAMFLFDCLLSAIPWNPCC
uniref:Uncharacterized protein n=1 Tax=Oryza glumipatula TaxID=40148 RepID=A0A0E0AB77_9ORYZ